MMTGLYLCLLGLGPFLLVALRTLPGNTTAAAAVLGDLGSLGQFFCVQRVQVLGQRQTAVNGT